MKKSIIWLLALIMFMAFFALLFLQVKYMRTSMSIRNQQFDEIVKRSLYNVSKDLEKAQAYRYLKEDMEHTIASQHYGYPHAQTAIEDILKDETTTSSIMQRGDGKRNHEQQLITKRTEHGKTSVFLSPNRGSSSISRTSQAQQKEFAKRYFHEQALIHEVLLQLLNRAGNEPIEKRIDFQELNRLIRLELMNNGLTAPFSFQIINYHNQAVYASPGFSSKDKKAVYQQILFPNDPPAKLNALNVYFPTKRDFVYGELSFFVPSLIFTFVILITFIFTIVTLFRQKRLSEMKNDFINNMTHELKTPVSTISLAAQMLKDQSITKSPEVFKHVTGVINDETKRLSFQVEKVLQMSLFDKQKARLKLKEVDANELVVNVANTHVLKVEKFGGTLEIDLQAENTRIVVDEMHFTNVLFNLLDNALKYKREEVAPELMIRTKNEGNKLIISVEDNGIGIKKEDVKKVFDRFYRVPTGNRHDVKGFGLGLAYVKKIVTDLNGTIRAESELKKGTKFIISLPVIKEK